MPPRNVSPPSLSVSTRPCLKKREDCDPIHRTTMVLRMILIYLISRNDLLIDPKSSTKAVLLICFYLIRNGILQK